MKQFAGYAIAAAAGAAVGYLAAKGKIPESFSINIPYGPKLSIKKSKAS